MTDDNQPITEKLKAAQEGIVSQEFDSAIALVEAVLVDAPQNIDALYMKAVSLRYLKEFQPAKDTLSYLLEISPDFGRAYQEMGHVNRDQGAISEALEAYKRAVTCNPALVASWQAQANIFEQHGQTAEANYARSHASRIENLPKELVAATNFLHEGKLLKSEKLCRRYLKKNPHHIEAMRILADLGVKFGVLEDAEFLLESAAEFDPENVQVRLDLIQVLRKRQKHDLALTHAQRLYDGDEKNPIFQSHLAVQNMHVGEFEQAFALFDKVLSVLPNDTATMTSKGHALKTFGRHEEAIASYKAAYKADPAHGDAYYSLANLKTYEFTDDEILQMKVQLESNFASFQSKIHLNFALGKAFEDRESYEDSMQYYQQGNDLKLIQCKYDPEQMSLELELQKQVCDIELFSKHASSGCEAPDPIFILGLPRAGSTLLEQILASHSLVDGTLELPNILSLSHRLRRGRSIEDEDGYPKILRTLSSDQLHKLGESYVTDTRIHRQDGVFFIDKMPNNFRHIGLIHLILPKAKIIDARRHPMDCCFSGFKQLFAEGQEFTYGQRAIGKYYKDYVDLMAHWDKVLPGRILRVQYEDVVVDFDNQVRRLLDFCGLDFEQSCIDFHKTERIVRTASSEQVRQPINTKGIEQWKHYESWLEELKTALGDAYV